MQQLDGPGLKNEMAESNLTMSCNQLSGVVHIYLAQVLKSRALIGMFGSSPSLH